MPGDPVAKRPLTDEVLGVQNVFLEHPNRMFVGPILSAHSLEVCTQRQDHLHSS